MIEKLRQLKKKSHMTNQQIAEKSNIPESTVARIFSGKTPNPTIATVISMARAMGGSAVDLLNEDDVKKTEDDPEFTKPDSDSENAISGNNASAESNNSAESSTSSERGPSSERNTFNERNAFNESVGGLSASEDKSSVTSDYDISDSSKQTSRPLEDITSNEKLYEDIIEFYKNEIKKKDVWLTRLFWCLVGIMLFILIILVFDIANPNFGYVKY